MCLRDSATTVSAARKGTIHHAVTAPRHTVVVERQSGHRSHGPRLVLLRGQLDAGRGDPSAGSGTGAAADAGRVVAGEVAAVLAGATDEVLAGAPLALPLALSVCMERHGVGAEELLESMRLLRRAVLLVSGLDAATEPVPIASGEPRAAVLCLADYLHGLLTRAAGSTGHDRGVIASSAAAHLLAS